MDETNKAMDHSASLNDGPESSEGNIFRRAAMSDVQAARQKRLPNAKSSGNGNDDETGLLQGALLRIEETKKILGDDSVQVVATAVRVPVQGGHSESVNVQLEKPSSTAAIKKLMHETEGVVLKDNPDVNAYPMPLYSEGRDEVFVGRIREDFTQENTYNMWIVADNLRKGAATNAIQIAEYLVEKGLLKGNETFAKV